MPPDYQRQQPVKRPKLGLWVGVIDATLEEDKTRPAKRRHTAKRVLIEAFSTETMNELCAMHASFWRMMMSSREVRIPAS